MWDVVDPDTSDPLSISKALSRWTNEFGQHGINCSVKRTFDKTTSASQVYYWRLWSYLYVVGVQRSAERISICDLPYDPEVAKMLTPFFFKEVGFHVNTKKLLTTKWGEKLRKTLDEHFRWWFRY